VRFFICTAEAIRKVQPDARICGFSTLGIESVLIDHGLDYLRDQGKLSLMDEVSYHPYNMNPDVMYDRVEQLRRLIALYSDKIVLRQGENGVSSQGGGFGAMKGPQSSEMFQAKWATRRMMGDLGRDIRSGYFTLADIHYGKGGICAYGLLKTNPDKTIAYAKPAYRTVQNIVSTFDGTQKRIWDFTWYQDGIGYQSSPYSVFGYQAANGKDIVTIWRNDEMPMQKNTLMTIHLVLPKVVIEDPVWADLRSGAVYALPKSAYERDGERLIIRQFPVYDSVVLLADKSALHFVKERNPFPMDFGVNSMEDQGDKEREKEKE
jgi:hypothetical protein